MPTTMLRRGQGLGPPLIRARQGGGQLYIWTTGLSVRGELQLEQPDLTGGQARGGSDFPKGALEGLDAAWRAVASQTA